MTILMQLYKLTSSKHSSFTIMLFCLSNILTCVCCFLLSSLKGWKRQSRPLRICRKTLAWLCEDPFQYYLSPVQGKIVKECILVNVAIVLLQVACDWLVCLSDWWNFQSGNATGTVGVHQRAQPGQRGWLWPSAQPYRRSLHHALHHHWASASSWRDHERKGKEQQNNYYSSNYLNLPLGCLLNMHDGRSSVLVHSSAVIGWPNKNNGI